MAENPETHNQRSQYPPPDDPNSGNYYNQGSPRGQPPPRDDRNLYPSQPPQGPPPQGQDPARQGQYQGPYQPDPRAQAHYPPPQQWGPPPPGYGPPPHYDPHHPHGYQYPPRPEYGQGPPQPMQPDAYRHQLPPPVPPYYHPYPPYAAPQAPAPRQRTAIACKYCRKRKIRCSGYDSSSDGRCANCVRFNQQCLFHPVSSQATFVPASAVYGPNAGRGAGQAPDGAPNGAMLYGAHGQPLGPANQQQASYAYPPPHYPPQPYSPAGPPQYPQHGPPGEGYPAHQPQGPPGEQNVSQPRKRPPPDDGAHESSQSPHPASRPRNSYDYGDQSAAPTSPATSQMSYQSSHPQANNYTNGHQKTNSPPAGLTPQSAQSFNSPRALPIRDDGKTPPPQPGSAGSSTNGRSGMSISDMVGGSHHGGVDQRARNDVDALKKLDGKK